jgi:hypothetical protein
MLPGFETCESVERTTSQPLISLPVVFPARTLAMPEEERGLQGSGADYGLSSPESFANFDLDTHLWKTLQRSLLGDYQTYSERWPRSGTMRNGTVYRLPTLAPLTGGIVSSSLPTPKASDAERGGRGELLALVRGKKTRQMWPTPTVVTGTGGAAMCKWGGSGARKRLRSMVSDQEFNGALNPTWQEWLMGFPLDWTDLEEQATP